MFPTSNYKVSAQHSKLLDVPLDFSSHFPVGLLARRFWSKIRQNLVCLCCNLQEQIQKKTNDDAHQTKIDRLHWLINYYNMSLTSAEVQRAQHCLKGYDQEAMVQAEEAFLRAVNQDRNRCNLAYFFGILKNIQQDLDDQRYREYCRQCYSYQLHLENQRMQQERQNECQASVEGVLKLVVTAMGLSEDFIRKKALGNCKRKLKELLFDFLLQRHN